MKIRLTGATFDASAKTIVHTSFSDVGLGGVQVITNVTDNIIIYNFADPAKGGSLSTDTLTLDYDTTSMDDIDELMILVEDGSNTQPVSGTVTANIGTVGTLATAAKQDTIIGHVDGIEGLLTTVDGDTGNISTKIDAIAGAVAGTEMQVDVVAPLPAGTNAIGGITLTGNSDAQLKDDSGFGENITSGVASVHPRLWDGTGYDRQPGNSTDGALVNLGANNDVTVTGSVTANAGTNLNTSALALESGGNLAAAAASLATLDNIVAGSEAQVDIVAALPAGTNALGKLLPPDIDVTGHTNYAKKYYTNAGSVTDGIIWSPAAGKRWHVVSLFIQVSAAATVTIEDDKAGGDEAVMKMELAANSGISIPFPEKYPLASGEDAADLLITTTAGNVYVTAVGYEV